MTPGTPAADVAIDAGVVGELLRAQHPDLAPLPIEPLGEGWDNAMFRVGEALVVRMPRRREGVPLIRNEQAWLPELADRLPLPIPAPVRLGRPGAGYPWPWSIVPWLPGRAADLATPAAHQAPSLAAFLRALHRPAPVAAPRNPLRGVPLAQRADAVEERLARLGDRITPALRAVWRAGLAATPAPEHCWLHGDLHARNVLVRDGALCGVIDWGDLCAGDPATDLASVWMLLAEPAARAAALAAYAPCEALRARALGWAVFFGSVLLDSGRVDDPRLAAMGEATLRRVAEDAG